MTGEPAERDYRYDAFISYHREASHELATALQRWLERFATPWYRPRSLRIFRDSTSLAAGDSLSQGLQDAMADSRSFVLLASPQAAASKWVGQEVEWWAKHRSSATFFIVLASGQLVWRDADADWDWNRTDALPRSASRLFEQEPIWIDLSKADPRQEPDNALLNDVAQIAAPLRGTDKDALFGEHLTLHRRARRQRRGAVATLAFLLVAALIATFAAVNQTRIARDQRHEAQEQRDSAQQERDMALSRLLSLKSQDIARSDPQTAAQLLIAANRLSVQNDQARVALANLMLNTPWAATVAAHDVAVRAMAVRPDGTTVTSLGADRTVTSWNTTRSSPPARSALPSSGTLDTVAVAIAPNALAAATIDGRIVEQVDGGYETFSELKPVHVWDLSDGTATGRSTVIPLTRNEATAPLLAFSPDARRLAVAEGYTVSIWTLPTAGRPRLEGRLRGPSLPEASSTGLEPQAEALAFSPDGTTLAFLSDVSLSLWDVSGRTRRLLDSITNFPFLPPMQFSPDGRMLAIGGEGPRGTILRVSISEQNRLRADTDHLIELDGAIAFHPNSRSLTIGDYRGRIRRWSGREGNWPGPIDQDLAAGSSAVTALSYLRDGRLVAASANGEITLWRTPGHRYRPAMVPIPAPGEKEPDRVVFSAELRTMASTTNASTTFWDVTGGKTPRKISSVAGIDPIFLTERQVLTTIPAVGDETEERTLLSDFTTPGRPRSTMVDLHGYPTPIGHTGFFLTNSSPGDDPGGSAQIWRLPADDQPPVLVANLPGYASALSERYIVSEAKERLLWDLRSLPNAVVPAHPFDLPHDPDSVSRLSPDNRTFVASSQDGLDQTTLWDLSDPARVSVAAALPGTAGRELWSAAFSGDAKLLATGLNVASLVLWDVTDPHRPVKLSEMTSPTDNDGRLREIGPPLVLSPDGRSLLSGEVDGAVILWDVSDPRSPARMTSFPVPDDDEPGVRFSPDGNTVAVGDTLWSITDLNRLRAGALKQACERAGDGLGEAEWMLYAPGSAYRRTC